jgi:hypothetical protein
MSAALLMLGEIKPTSQFVSPIETYFGFIVLGLMMCIGYIVVRRFSAPRRDPSEKSLEQALREAEAEAYRRMRERPPEPKDPLDPLPESTLAPLTPEQEVEQAKLRRLLSEKQPPPPPAKDS